VAKRIEKEFKKRPFEAILLGGDLNYANRGRRSRKTPSGDLSTMHRSVRDATPSLYKQGVVALPVIGNRDEDASGASHVPAYFGLGTTREYQQLLAGGDVEVFVVDTNSLIARPDPRQVPRLKAALARSTARYKIVLGHHPMYSSQRTRHSTETALVRRELERVMSRNGVALYLAGHHHHYERSRPIKGVVHVTAGGGGRRPGNIRALTAPDFPRAHVSAQNHFLRMEVTKAGLRVEAVSAMGQVLDSVTVKSRQAL